MQAAIPIIRFEVEHLKHSILVALSDYQIKFSSEVKQAIETACEPEKIQRLINETVSRNIREIVSKEVENFFTYGEGREALRQAVENKLSSTVRPRKS